MAKTTALPKSRAKTAYGLLSEIRRLILAEPKRYDQFQWLTRRRHVDDHDNFPSCGTIGCVAGWVVALKSPRTRNIEVSAAKILGFDPYGHETTMLFGCAVDGVSQTATHARSGAAHIARFQARFAAQLKAKRV